MSEPEQVSAGGRTIRVRGVTLKQLRVQKGWTILRLAEKSLCSAKTVAKAEHGGDVYPAVLMKLAKALGVEQERLIQGPEPATPEVPETPAFPVSIVFQFPPEVFAEGHPIRTLIDELARIAALAAKPMPDDVRDGSVIVDLSLGSEADVRSLVRAFCRGDLAELSISEIRVPFVIDLAGELARSQNPSYGDDSGVAEIMRRDFSRGDWVYQFTTFNNNHLKAHWRADTGWTLELTVREQKKPAPPPSTKAVGDPAMPEPEDDPPMLGPQIAGIEDDDDPYGLFVNDN